MLIFRICVSSENARFSSEHSFKKTAYLDSICSKEFGMEFQIGELCEKHQKYNRNTHRYIQTQQKRLPAAEAVKKAHMSHKICLST